MEKINTVAGALEKLNVKLGGVEGEINPKMQKVEALKKIYATLGGASEDVDELSTTYELVAKIADVAEGGNPNSVQVITGTLAEPFGDVSTLNLGDEMFHGNASAILEVDFSEYGFDIISWALWLWENGFSSDLAFSVALISSEAVIAAVAATWPVLSGRLDGAYLYSEDSVTDITTIASQIPTTLTIYWHPMPETEGE